MPRYVAFLRAINVGGHVVKMDRLRALFEQLGHANVETFIASGNVVFESRSKATAGLERAIEAALGKTLGYDVATFVRTDEEVASLAGQQPFAPAAFKSARAFCVGFFKEPLSREAEKILMGFKTPADDFRVDGREMYWLCQTGQSDSKFTNAGFERLAKIRATFRNMNTVQRLTAKYPPGRNRP
jgi:uncharacterized protein (DUF1697 family)